MGNLFKYYSPTWYNHQVTKLGNSKLYEIRGIKGNPFENEKPYIMSMAYFQTPRPQKYVNI